MQQVADDLLEVQALHHLLVSGDVLCSNLRVKGPVDGVHGHEVSPPAAHRHEVPAILRLRLELIELDGVLLQRWSPWLTLSLTKTTTVGTRLEERINRWLAAQLLEALL